MSGHNGYAPSNEMANAAIRDTPLIINLRNGRLLLWWLYYIETGVAMELGSLSNAALTPTTVPEQTPIRTEFLPS